MGETNAEDLKKVAMWAALDLAKANVEARIPDEKLVIQYASAFYEFLNGGAK